MTAWRYLRQSLLAAALLGAAISPAQAAGDGLEGLVPGSPAASLYGSNHLAGLPDKAELVFDYRFEGTAMEKPFADDVFVDLTRQSGGERNFDVEVTLFSHTRNQMVGPLSAASVNPILLIFFQHDATHMSNGTGGSQSYFRNEIRRALQTPTEGSVRAITITLDGQQLAASEITIRPFAGDADRARLRGFADKVYRFILSDRVPGSIYEVQTETPTEDGGAVLLRETYRFREIRS
jgi:hypothetical protein